MIRMEFRAWIKVPEIDVESEEAGQLLDALNQRHGSFGPVLSGAGDGVEVILSTAEPEGSEVKARALMLGVVTDTLLSSGIHQRPTGIELERVSSDAVVA